MSFFGVFEAIEANFPRNDSLGLNDGRLFIAHTVWEERRRIDEGEEGSEVVVAMGNRSEVAMVAGEERERDGGGIWMVFFGFVFCIWTVFSTGVNRKS